MGTILLTSAGFHHEEPRSALERVLKPLGDSPRIVTILSGIPAKQRAGDQLVDYLLTLSPWVDTLDLHTQSADAISHYDVCIIGGGSPYVLLNLFRNKGPVLLKKFLAANKVLVGVSGGAMILGRDLGLTPLINPTIPKPKNFEFDALALFPENVFPHFGRFEDGMYDDRKSAVDAWLSANPHFAIRDEEAVVLKV